VDYEEAGLVRGHRSLGHAFEGHTLSSVPLCFSLLPGCHEVRSCALSWCFCLSTGLKAQLADHELKLLKLWAKQILPPLNRFSQDICHNHGKSNTKWYFLSLKQFDNRYQGFQMHSFPLTNTFHSQEVCSRETVRYVAK
jgi:hypothetical protein